MNHPSHHFIFRNCRRLFYCASLVFIGSYISLPSQAQTRSSIGSVKPANTTTIKPQGGIAGVHCGSAAGGLFPSPPTANLCAAGSVVTVPVAALGVTQYQWTCGIPGSPNGMSVCTANVKEIAHLGTRGNPFKLKCCDRPGAKYSADFLTGVTPLVVLGPPHANVNNTFSVKSNSSWNGSGGTGAQWIQPGTLAQDYSEVAPWGEYQYRWYFEVPQCNTAPPNIPRQPFMLSGKVASDNYPTVKLTGAVIASSTDMWAFMAGHEVPFSATLPSAPGLHWLDITVTNESSLSANITPAQLAQLQAQFPNITPAQIAQMQSIAATSTSPTGLSARANISQYCPIP